MVSVESFGWVASSDPLRPGPVRQSDGIAGPGAGNLSVLVTREAGTVVVTVDGTFGAAGCGVLEALLSDLIDGQGNIAVVVDLGPTIVDQEGFMLLREAARRARDHGARLSLRTLRPATSEWAR